jgi:hypothetical protein
LTIVLTGVYTKIMKIVIEVIPVTKSLNPKPPYKAAAVKSKTHVFILNLFKLELEKRADKCDMAYRTPNNSAVRYRK